jgi:cytidylate kinase
MNVIISGLTAAGKTTHCLLLSHKFKLTRISAADLLVKASGLNFTVDSSDSGFWVSEEAKQLVALMEQSKDINLEVDAELKRLSETSDNIVFDAWGLPWISSAPALRIWLESSLESRLLKSLVSHRNNKHVARNNLRTLIKKKDRDARDLFLSLYSFDIYNDREVFDLVIDISSFIRKPHLLSSKNSIRLADQIISGIVGWRLEKSEVHKAALKKYLDAYGDKVFITYPKDVIE